MFSYKLPNGMRVVGESMPGYRSVSMGVFINAGSVYETEGENGAAHFIEHMLFKGTKTRTASQIAEEMDAVGGNLNAFTSKECTCFYGRVLGDRVSTLSEILADLITNSLLSEEDIEREKGVVCEEIMMTEDTPEDLVTETAVAGFYEGDPLERPILGTVDSVRAFTREGLVGYMERLYRPENTVVSAAGNFDKDELIASLEAGFGGMKAGEGAEVDFGLHRPAKRLRFIKKDIEQAHICICLPGFRKDTKESYAQMILSNAFGGSMSSRLFQRIREERGLAYSVYSYPTAFRQSGFMTLYAGTGAENAATVTEMMLEQIDILKREGVTEEELERSKKQIIAGFLMAQESTSARSSAIGRAELLRGKHMTEDEVIERINSVAMDDIYGILPVICNTEDVSAAFVGRIGGSEKRLRELMRG
ncbi:MAG: insulinase family protein [Clostridiales bacterium]|nr:insulinase family protein [Clostridiales bacterium]